MIEFVHPRSFIFPTALCVAGMVSEAVLAGKNANAIMRSLQQPAWALPMWAWYFVGLAYYAGCFISLYMLSNASPTGTRSVGLALLVAVMIANAAWNFLFFRRKDLRLSFWFFLPYSILVVALVYTLTQISMTSAGAFMIYLLYLPYALAWSYRTWKLNARQAVLG